MHSPSTNAALAQAKARESDLANELRDAQAKLALRAAQASLERRATRWRDRIRALSLALALRWCSDCASRRTSSHPSTPANTSTAATAASIARDAADVLLRAGAAAGEAVVEMESAAFMNAAGRF